MQRLVRPSGLRGGGGHSQEHTTYLERLMDEESSSEIERASSLSPSRCLQADDVSRKRSGPLGQAQTHRTEDWVQDPKGPLRELTPHDASQRADSICSQTPPPATTASQTGETAQSAESVLAKRRKLLVNIQQHLQESIAETAADASSSDHRPYPSSKDEIRCGAANAGAMSSAGESARLQAPWQHTTHASARSAPIRDQAAGGAGAGVSPSETVTALESVSSALADEPSLEDYIATPPGQMAMESLRRWGWQGSHEDLQSEASHLLRCLEGQPHFLGVVCATGSCYLPLPRLSALDRRV